MGVRLPSAPQVEEVRLLMGKPSSHAGRQLLVRIIALVQLPALTCGWEARLSVDRGHDTGEQVPLMGVKMPFAPQVEDFKVETGKAALQAGRQLFVKTRLIVQLPAVTRGLEARLREDKGHVTTTGPVPLEGEQVPVMGVKRPSAPQVEDVKVEMVKSVSQTGRQLFVGSKKFVFLP